LRVSARLVQSHSRQVTVGTHLTWTHHVTHNRLINIIIDIHLYRATHNRDTPRTHIYSVRIYNICVHHNPLQRLRIILIRYTTTIYVTRYITTIYGYRWGQNATFKLQNGVNYLKEILGSTSSLARSFACYIFIYISLTLYVCCFKHAMEYNTTYIAP